MQNTHFSEQMRRLHGSVLDIVKTINRPQMDEMMVRDAGIPLDRALFPLLVLIERFGPIGVVDLADRVGRDYTTVSRQIAKLESVGLVDRHPSPSDKRVHEAIVTQKGKVMTDAVDAARERMAHRIFAAWDKHDVETLVHLMRRFADALNGEV